MYLKSEVYKGQRIGQKRDLLQKYYEMACHNLLCYSDSYLADKPIIGHENEWEEIKVECELLKEMIEEMDVKYGHELLPKQNGIR